MRGYERRIHFRIEPSTSKPGRLTRVHVSCGRSADIRDGARRPWYGASPTTKSPRRRLEPARGRGQHPMEVPACLTVRANDHPAELPEPTQEIPLARDLTTCVLDFVRDRVTPVAEWVTWTGGDPDLVLLVVSETLRSIADGLEADPPDE